MEHRDLQDRVSRYVDASRDAMLAFWKDLVNTESGSLDKPSVDAAAEKIVLELESFGVEAETIQWERAGNGITGVLGKGRPGAPVALLGHFDTVFPKGTASERPFRMENGRAYGPGVLDMKGGIAVLVFAAKALEASGYRKRPLRFILAGDEETGHGNSGMGKIFEERARGCAAAFNCETGDPENRILVARKGSMHCEMRVKGLAVHAGKEPQKGRSAILEIARKIVDIHALTDFERGLTFNVGTVGGGVAPNAVPDSATAGIDARFLNGVQMSEAKRKLEEIAARTYVDGTSTGLEFCSCLFPMERTQGNERLFRLVRETSLEMGLPEPSMDISGGASDSAYSVLAGVPTVDAMGVTGEWNHSSREYALADSLFERTKLLASCILRMDRFQNWNCP